MHRTKDMTLITVAKNMVKSIWKSQRQSLSKPQMSKRSSSRRGTGHCPWTPLGLHPMPWVCKWCAQTYPLA